MIDTSTGDRLLVSDGGDAGPDIIVPLAQRDDMCRLLDRYRVGYTVDEAALSLNDEPPLSVINLSQNTDVEVVQRILDERE